jgi:hypothetical protein
MGVVGRRGQEAASGGAVGGLARESGDGGLPAAAHCVALRWNGEQREASVTQSVRIETPNGISLEGERELTGSSSRFGEAAA